MALYPYPLEDAPTGSQLRLILKNTSDTNSYSSTTKRSLDDVPKETWGLSSYNDTTKIFNASESGYNLLMFEINYLDEGSAATLEFQLEGQQPRTQVLPNNGEAHQVAISFVTT